MKAPITAKQAITHPDVATIIDSLGRIADELLTERDELAAETKLWRDRHNHVANTCACLHRSLDDLRAAAQQALDALNTCKETMTGTRFRYRDYDERRIASAKAALKEATNG